MRDSCQAFTPRLVFSLDLPGSTVTAAARELSTTSVGDLAMLML